MYFVILGYMIFGLKKSSRFDENGWRWLRQFVEQLRIPMLVDKDRIKTEALKINWKNQKEMSETINAMISNIYNFTQEEEKYINQKLSKY